MKPTRHRRHRGHAPSRDRWVIPYADFVTLLFAFFTALYAVTSVDASRLPSVAEGLRHAVGVTGGPAPSENGTASGEPPATKQPGNVSDPDVRAAIARELQDDLLAKRLELTEDRRGLVLAIPEAFAFDLGKAELSPVAESLMVRVAHVLGGLPNAVRVEGHTDTTPIHTAQFSSNWELSTARATRVVDFFITAGAISPDRLSAAGYSQYHPRAANDSAAGRVRNRRVDIVILNAATTAAEEPGR